MAIKHILFDLDGTLLPMDQDRFVSCYMPLLAKSYIKSGFSFDPKDFIAAVWKGYRDMVKNDGSRTNRIAFWESMQTLLPIPMEESEPIADCFYATDFNQAIVSTNPNPLSAQIVKTAKEKGLVLYLATNPVFPRAATANRIKWAGLQEDDFRLITTYEDCSYCKPNPLYFKAILDQFSLDPSECLMVGNDVEEDLAIRSLGVATFLVTDTMENKKNLVPETEYQGSLEELLHFIETL